MIPKTSTVILQRTIHAFGSKIFGKSFSKMDKSYTSAPTHLDGTTLEGGGQLLRLAVSLSSLTKIPIKVTDIRGNRGPISSPGQAGGLKAAHLAAVEWLAKATVAETEGMHLKSKNLTFYPHRVYPESRNNDDSHELSSEPRGQQAIGVWKDVFENGKLVRRDSHIPLATPGSVLLILQAILPYLLFGSSPFSSDQSFGILHRIKISGGTNVSKSPSIDYVSQVLLPMLSMKLGLPEITTTLHKRGWSTGGTQIGSVTFDVMPFQLGQVLPRFDIRNRGELARVYVSILAPDSKARDTIRDEVIKQLLALRSEVEIEFPIDEESKNEKRWYLLLVAETSSGFRLGRDWLFDLKTKGVNPKETCRKLVTKVVKDLSNELNHGGCVDEFMQDQLVVFQALADGHATVDSGAQKASLHTKTARWVAEKALGVMFDERGDCEGVRFSVGEDFEERPPVGEAVRGMAEMKI